MRASMPPPLPPRMCIIRRTTRFVRPSFMREGTYLPYAEIFHRVKGMDCYHALPAKVANSILILLHKNWIAFFEALEAYQADPSRFTGRPRLPKYSGLGQGAQYPHL